MKISLKLLSIIFIFVFSFFSCENNNSIRSPFVQIKNQQFFLNGEKHFVYMLNYIIALRNVDGEIMFGATREYEDHDKFDSTTPEEVKEELNKHFKFIAEMGFNTVRISGFQLLEYSKLYPHLGFPIFYQDEEGKITKEIFNVSENFDAIIKAMEGVVEAASNNNLKLMILFPRPRQQKEYNKHRINYIKAILHKFSAEPTIFAYDFFNEPLYFDNAEIINSERKPTNKKEARKKSRYWRKLMDEYAPNQLLTIGSAEPIEVFNWDPTMLDVDFLAFHTYNPLRVKNEIYWYAKNSNKPWMVGETGLPTDNDSISYLAQEVFMKEALQQTIDCGGIGYGWWQFQDVYWGTNFEHTYLGLLNHKDTTITQDGDIILGSLKNPNLPYFTEDLEKGECECGTNYYNMLGYENYVLEGKIVDDNNQPIEDAVIRGWSKEWIGVNTFTKADGTFKLYSNTPMVHFSFSAKGKQLVKFDRELQYKIVDESMDSTLNNEFLEYQKIHFKNFLKEGAFEEGLVFDFDKELFDLYKYRADIGTIELQKYKLFPEVPTFFLGW